MFKFQPKRGKKWYKELPHHDEYPGYIALCGCCLTCGISFPVDIHKKKVRKEFKEVLYRDSYKHLRHLCEEDKDVDES